MEITPEIIFKLFEYLIWPLLGLVLYGWRAINSRVNGLESENISLGAKLDALPTQEALQEINVELARIQGSMEAISVRVENNGTNTKSAMDSIKWIEKYLREHDK